jgi:hypothetical protein
MKRGAGPKATARNYVPRSGPQFNTDSSRIDYSDEFLSFEML